MEKFKNTITAMALALVFFTSCQSGRTTTMSVDDGTNSQKVEYRGKVIFNAEQNGIEKITDGGFLKFERNGERFEAENDDKGRIVYSFNGDSKITELSEQQKQLLSDAIKAIVKQRAQQRGN